MPRRALVVVLVGLVFVGGLAVWRITRMEPDTASRTTPTSSTLPVAPREAPAAASPTPAAPASASRPARRAPTPSTEPAAAAPEAAPTVGILHIDSDITGAQVFLDRNYVGVTPVTAPDVVPGPHRLNIVAPGYESIAENIDVQPGPRDLQFNFKEIRLDAAIDVVHKHRLGSCKGRLVATPQGLRYDTDDKDDRFSLPLGDIETFDVDYLAKVLRVKLVKGKRYEFTDPGSTNADRLFVFHRDVDKVRQRLK